MSTWCCSCEGRGTQDVSNMFESRTLPCETWFVKTLLMSPMSICLVWMHEGVCHELLQLATVLHVLTHAFSVWRCLFCKNIHCNTLATRHTSPCRIFRPRLHKAEGKVFMCACSIQSAILTSTTPCGTCMLCWESTMDLKLESMQHVRMTPGK